MSDGADRRSELITSLPSLSSTMHVSHSVRLVLFALIAHITLGFSPPQLFTSLSKNKFPDAIVSRNSALFDSSPVQRYEGDLDTDVLYVQSKFPINPFDLVSLTHHKYLQYYLPPCMHASRTH